MATATRITRRLALGALAVVGLGAAAYGSSLAACGLVKRNRPDFFALLDAVPDDDASRRVGRAMLASGQASRELSRLAASLGERPLIRAALDSGCPDTRRALVQAQCRADFVEGRMVAVDGWVLSRTEAELCAAAGIARSV